MATARRKSAKTSDSGPDGKDARQAIEALWDDYKLYFRATIVLRDGKYLLRAYAHDGCSLSQSDKVYQSYIKFEDSGSPLLWHATYRLAFDLYWQAQSDEANNTLGTREAAELPDVPRQPKN